MPVIEMNWLAIGVAVVAHFMLGFIWFTFLFGKPWAEEMGMDINEKPESSAMMKSMGLNLIGNFLMVFVWFHDLAAWNPVTWGKPPAEISNIMFALSGSFFTWLGFFLPVSLNTVAWEKKSWKLLMINSSYHFVSLFVTALIILSM